jgi:hypothetical protein
MKRGSGRIRASLAVLSFPFLLETDAAALTAVPVEVECPVDGTRTRSMEMLSGTVFCMRLDLKPVGAIASPPPIHECPKDGYVWHSDDLTESELDSVRRWIRSEPYRQLRSESPHFRLARIYQAAGRDSLTIARALLQASWEVESTPERHERYLAESLSHLVRHLDERTTGAAETEGRASHEILAAELERRLGEFDAAEERLERLRREDRVTTPREKEIVEYEMDLVARGDSEPHCLPRQDEERCRSYDRSRGGM